MLGLLSMGDKNKKGTTLKIMKVLKLWEDADFFSLKVKKKVAEHIVNEIEDDFKPPPRGL